MGLRTTPQPKIELDEPRSPGGIILTGIEPAIDQQAVMGIPAYYTWGQYSDWRKSKCPPEDFHFAVWLDEMDQSIHEFVGEAAELAEILLEVGPFVRINEDATAKVLNEIGDTIFTASWVFDQIDPSFLPSRGFVKDGFLPEEARDRLTTQHSGIALIDPHDLHNLSKSSDETQSAVIDWHQEVMGTLLNLTVSSGFLSNCFKKMRWHRTPQSQHDSAERIFNAFVSIDAVCVLTGIKLFDAVQHNVEKLNKRFPDGWKAGGGNRSK